MVNPKPNIQKLYREPPSFENRIGRVERLDRNERTTPFPEYHMKEILKNVVPDEISAYPDLEPVYYKLAQWLNINRDELLLTTGADTAIRSVYEVYIEEGDEVIILNPTYAMFAVYCDMFGALKKEVFYNDDFSLPASRIIESITPKTKMIAIANPNHTGTAIPESDLLQILQVTKDSEIIFLVDETYYHFYEGTLQSYIAEYDNLIITRSFSKAFGMAGLRVGYIISNKDTTNQLYKVKLTHEITSLSAKFVDYLLDHLEVLTDQVRDVEDGKNYLREEFSKLGIQAPESCANFILAKLPDEIDGKKLVGLLLENGFAIKGPFSNGLLKGFVRITAGPVTQMESLMKVFGEIYTSLVAGVTNIEF